MSDLLTTPLNAWHKENGARMVPFAGWEMPVQYEGILAEHTHTRSSASLFDICHMGEFKLRGPEVKEALAKVVTHNLDTLGPGRCRYGFLLNPEGGVLDDLIIYCLADGDYMLVVNGSRITGDYQWIKSHLPQGTFFEDVSETTAKIDLQGPKSCDVLEEALSMSCRAIPYFGFQRTEFREDPLIVSRTGYTGELGYELYMRSDRALDLWKLLVADERVKPAGLGARDTLRLEIGYPLYGQDLDEDHTPAESGGEFFLKSKADYVGRDKAFEIRESLIPLALEGRRSARHNDVVLTTSGREAGHVTSGSYAPSLGHAVALAYVAADVADEDDFVISTGKAKLAAKRVSLPFFTEGTARIKL